MSGRGRLPRCSHCHGKGTRRLRPWEVDTLRALSGSEWRATPEIAKRLPKVAHTALCNRLARLAVAGLVEGIRGDGPRGVMSWRLT